MFLLILILVFYVNVYMYVYIYVRKILRYYIKLENVLEVLSLIWIKRVVGKILDDVYICMYVCYNNNFVIKLYIFYFNFNDFIKILFIGD